jgi:DNA topoisomerase-1
LDKHTLIITEKPDAARRIASALDEKDRPRKLSQNGVPYYLAKRDTEIVVVPALGHLYTIAGKRKGRDNYPVLSFEWVPRYIAERRAAWIRNWLNSITALAKDADDFVDACDFDLEGCVIGYCILKYACGNKEHVSRRMKFSTLTKHELEKAYDEPLSHLDFGLIEAGRARHEVDWLYGINLSRALTTATRKWRGKCPTLSTGRVQGPTLKFLVAREEAIRSFVPTPYWEIKAQVEIDCRVFEARHMMERIDNRREAENIVNSCKDKQGWIEEIDVREFKQSPPFPFDLGTLQNEAYSLFRYSPQRTLNISQRLYLDALISYPRTDSQKLPPTIDYRTILKKLGKAEEYSKFTSELLRKQTLKPNEGKKDDSAHPAIYPTANLPREFLETSERKMWDLVVRRFIAVFGDPAVRQSIRVYVRIDGHCFYFSGRRTLVEGWIRYYDPYARFDEILLVPLKKGQKVNVKKMVLEDKFTQPQPRYNPSSLLNCMEEARIGTKATRADIIQTLYNRRYISGERITVTELGLEVLDVLEKHCPPLVSTALTRELEEKMDKIRENKEKREEIVADVIRTLETLLAVFKENENAVGEQLNNALKRTRLQERIISACPVCKTGKLFISYSRKTGKRFIGCTNYFEGLCKVSFPLPQKGPVKSTGKRCPACGWPTVETRMARRSWVLCFNLQCPSKKEIGKVEMSNM